MPIATPTPEALRGFALGTLAPGDAERIAAWIDETPGADERAAAAGAPDTLVAIISTIGNSGLTAEPNRDRDTSPGVTRPYAPGPVDPAQQFAGYRDVREIGRGGMGVVYEGTDEHLLRKVAIKELNPALAADPVARDRFLREAQAAAAIKSPHAVTIHHIADVPGSPYMVMEFIDGGSLQEWLAGRPGPVTAAEVKWVARHILIGLAAAHELGLIHRDIKPSNVMFEQRTGTFKVVDFGLARFAGAGATVPRVDRGGPGTLRYMSPEQIDLPVSQLTPASDLFSVGATLYQMVAGQSPVLGGRPVDAGGPFPLPGIPPALNRFILRLLAPKPDGRPANAAVALQELEALEHVHRVRKVVIGFALLAAAVAVVVIFRNRDGEELGRVVASSGVVLEIRTGDTLPPVGAAGATPKSDQVTTPPPHPAPARGTVTAQTGGFEDDATDHLRFMVGSGSRATQIRTGARARTLIQLEDVPGHEGMVWVETRLFKIDE